MLFLVWAATAALAADEIPPGCPGSEAFERMKALNGEWRGEVDSGGEAHAASVRYDVMSGGGVILETISPGEIDRAIAVYYDEEGGLALTRFGPSSTRSKMILKTDSPEKLRFELAPGEKAAQEPHYHALEIEFAKDGVIQETWFFHDGEEMRDSEVFRLERIKT